MKLPESFLALHANGCFDYWGGVAYDQLANEDRQRLYAERRPRVLWLRGIEWEIAPSEVIEATDLRPGLYRFAGDGAGGSYVFCPAWQRDAAEAPVVYVPHDEDTAQLFAPTFAQALLRLWLAHGSDWDAATDSADRDNTLKAWAAIIAPLLDPAQRAALEALAKDPTEKSMKAASQAFVAALPTDTMVAQPPPTKYNPKYVKGEQAKRLYAKSIAFYVALVAEGHDRYAKDLAETRANRDAAIGT
jgi:hypothetical protein